MSNVAFYSTDMRWGGAEPVSQVHDGLARGRTTAGGVTIPVPGGMLETAENLRRVWHLPRRNRTSSRCVASAGGGRAEGRHPRRGDHPGHGAHAHRGESSSTPTSTPRRHLRRVAGQAETRSAQEDPDATVTAGNASGQNDAASMCIVTTREKAAELGLKPLVRLVSWGSAASRRTSWASARFRRPRWRWQGRSAAERHRPDRTQRGVRRAGARRDAASGVHRGRPRTHERARLRDLARPPGRRDRRADARHAGSRTRSAQARYGLETMCIGGGQGLAAVFERVSRMTKLAQTLGLTEFQTEILATCGNSSTRRSFPTRRSSSTPTPIRRPSSTRCGDGPVRPDDPGGVRRARRVAADLRAVRRGAGPRLDERVGVINTHFIVAYMLASTAPMRRSNLPAADGHR